MISKLNTWLLPNIGWEAYLHRFDSRAWLLIEWPQTRHARHIPVWG